MAQHFLLSAAARTLSLKQIYAGSEEATYRRLCRLRWPATNGKPVCPRCAWPEAYVLSSRRKFKCKACHHQFSLTSGTIFASRKLPLSISSAPSRCSPMPPKDCRHCSSRVASMFPAFVLAHKLREALACETAR